MNTAGVHRRPDPLVILADEQRATLGISAADLARQVGMSHGVVSMYSAGTRNPTVRALRRVFAAVLWDLDDLWGLPANPPVPAGVDPVVAWLDLHRRAQGMKPGRLAAMSGIAASTWNRFAAGTSMPSLARVRRIAERGLGIEVPTPQVFRCGCPTVLWLDKGRHLGSCARWPFGHLRPTPRHLTVVQKAAFRVP